MLVIKTPATTSNLAVGFDALGMALSLTNEFEFELNPSFEYTGFLTEDSDNLVGKAYLAFCAYCNVEEPKPVKITMTKNEIPISRGLGSSASLILAGVVAANHFHELKRTKLECAAFASDYEGHPDNAFACMFGGFVATLKYEEGYLFDQFHVSDSLRFTILIPETCGSTEELRQVLPKKVAMEDAVFHLSRTIHLPKAFQEGNLDHLKILIQDRLHQQYRSSYIAGYDFVEEYASLNDAILFISGSGPTLFLLSDRTLNIEDPKIKSIFQIYPIQISSGTSWEVE